MGQLLAFSVGKAGTVGVSLWTLTPQDKKPMLLAQLLAQGDAGAAFSPDGHWMAYQSNETGQLGIFVQPFPPTGAKYQISKNGGRWPLWSPDGKELLYSFLVSGGEKLFAVNVATQPSFTFSNPVAIPVEGIIPVSTGPARDYDITPDGKYFIALTSSTQSERAGPQQVRPEADSLWRGDGLRH